MINIVLKYHKTNRERLNLAYFLLMNGLSQELTKQWVLYLDGWTYDNSAVNSVHALVYEHWGALLRRDWSYWDMLERRYTRPSVDN